MRYMGTQTLDVSSPVTRGEAYIGLNLLSH
jgi:hypothetical protein